MKKMIRTMLVLCRMFALSGCGKKEVTVVKTYAATDVQDVEKELAAGREVTMITYYEMSDGTWQIEDGHSYKYRLEVSGRTNAAESDSTFIYLSNQESISFDQAWKASGLSSNMDDYFDEADAKFVGMK